MAQTIGQPKRTVVAINGNAGAFVTISASRFARYVEIAECPPNGGAFTGGNYAPQGINYQIPDDNFQAQFALVPGDTFAIGEKDFPRDRAVGQPGWTDPDGKNVPATVYCKMKSATVTATEVEVREWS